MPRSLLLESGTDRAELVAQIRAGWALTMLESLVESEGMASSARDFLAFGTVRWMLRDLTIAMGHSDSIDYESLTRELLAAAHQWRIDDWSSAVNRLRAAFENLTQARERYYPVDAYLLDLCLIDPAMKEGVLAAPLARPIAISFLMPAQAVESQALHDPERMAALRQAINDGWADVAGGTYTEAEDALLPLESILWQFRHASEIYRLHLDDRNVETYARRRFGLHTRVPQIAKRFGFRYALHMGFDAGKFPIPAETKRLWESPDGGSLESLMRPPLAADRANQGWFLPWRMAATMRNDHVGALPLLHWPEPVAPWYSRPAASRQLFTRSWPLDHAQRFFPPDRPALRNHCVPSPTCTRRHTSLRQWRNGRPSRSGGWPGIIELRAQFERSGRSRHWPGRLPYQSAA